MAKHVNITLIHGTFAKNAAWTAETSAFRKSIVEGLDIETNFEKFEWSGRNSLADRIAAADQLRSELCSRHLASPESREVVIGHSHGGGILAYALSRHPELADYVLGIFLATPFIDARTRREWFLIARQTIVALLTLVNVVLYIVTSDFGPFPAWVDGPYSSWISISANAFLIATTLFAFVITSIPPSILSSKFDLEAVAKSISNCGLPHGKYLFVRTTGDEANSALSFAQFSAWLFSKLVTFLLTVLPPFLRLLTGGAFVVGGGIVGLMIWVTLFDFAYHGFPQDLSGGAFWSAIAFLFFTAGYAIGIVFVLVYFSIVSIFFLICWVGHRSFGRISLLTAMFIELVVEPIPVGSHIFTHAPWDPTETGLSHSSPYQNAFAVQIIRDWMNKTLQP